MMARTLRAVPVGDAVLPGRRGRAASRIADPVSRGAPPAAVRSALVCGRTGESAPKNVASFGLAREDADPVKS